MPTVLRLIILTLILGSCVKELDDLNPQYGSKPGAGKGAVYEFAVHPLYNPAQLMRAYQPLVEYLNSRNLGVRISLEASRDYGSFEQKFQDRRPEIILPNPWQTLEAMKVGYHVVATAGDPEDFRGLLLVRRDNNIKTTRDLMGKTVSYPSSTALAACIMPQYFLFHRGIDVNTDITNLYVGSQESALMSVYLGKSEVGVTWPPPWRIFQRNNPELAKKLKILWETESLINNSVMVRDDVPQEFQQKLTLALTELSKSPLGENILRGMETSRFLPAGNGDYDIVRKYMENFERDVRKVGQP